MPGLLLPLQKAPILCFSFDSHAGGFREKRLLFVDQPDSLLKDPYHENADDKEATSHRLGLLRNKVDTLRLEQKTQEAMKTLWDGNAKTAVADFLRTGNLESVGQVITDSGMSNNPRLRDVLWQKKGEQKYLINGAPLFRAQFIGTIEDFIRLQIDAESDEAARAMMRLHGSLLLEKMFAVESSKPDSATEMLRKSSLAVDAVDYLQQAGLAQSMKNAQNREALGGEMKNGRQNVDMGKMAFGMEITDDNGQTELWQWEKAHVLTGSIMMNVDPQLMESFILKDLIIRPGNNDNEKIVIARMQNGCQGNLFTAVLKRPPQPEPAQPVEQPAVPNEAPPVEQPAVSNETPSSTEPAQLQVDAAVTPGATLDFEVQFNNNDPALLAKDVGSIDPSRMGQQDWVLVQTALYRLGLLAADQINGQDSPQTQEALSRLQKKHNLLKNGPFDTSTRAFLVVELLNLTKPTAAPTEAAANERGAEDWQVFLDQTITTTQQNLDMLSNLQTMEPLKNIILAEVNRINTDAKAFKTKQDYNAAKEYFAEGAPSEAEKKFIEQVIARVDTDSEFHRRMVANENNINYLSDTSPAKPQLAEKYRKLNDEFNANLGAMRNNTVTTAPTAAAQDALRILLSIEKEKELHLEIAMTQGTPAPQAAPQAAPAPAMDPVETPINAPISLRPDDEPPVTFSAPRGDRQFSVPKEEFGIENILKEADLAQKKLSEKLSKDIESLVNSPTTEDKLKGELAYLISDLEAFQVKARAAQEGGNPIIADLQHEWQNLSQRMVNLENKIRGARKRDDLPTAELNVEQKRKEQQERIEREKIDKRIRGLFGSEDSFEKVVNEADALEVNGEKFFGNLRFSRIPDLQGKPEEVSKDKQNIWVRLESKDISQPAQIKEGDVQQTLTGPRELPVEFTVLEKLNKKL